MRGVDAADPAPVLRIVPQDTDVRLRPASPADDAFVANLFKIVRADVFAAAQLPPAMLDTMLDQQFRAQAASHAAQFPNALSFVITRDARPVGRLLLHVDAHHWHMVDIALISAARNQGIGTGVIAALAREARTQGVPQLRLMVLASNSGARRLYARLGFISTDAAKSGSHIMMAKPLDGQAISQ